MADLHLALKGEYFDAIKAGTKTEEYRLCNRHWINRPARLSGEASSRRILARTVRRAACPLLNRGRDRRCAPDPPHLSAPRHDHHKASDQESLSFHDPPHPLSERRMGMDYQNAEAVKVRRTRRARALGTAPGDYRINPSSRHGLDERGCVVRRCHWHAGRRDTLVDLVASGHSTQPRMGNAWPCQIKAGARRPAQCRRARGAETPARHP